MRLYMVLIFTTLILTFLSSYFFLSIKDVHVAGPEEILEIEDLKFSFANTVAPKAIINLSSLYFTKERFKLFSPVYALPDPTSRAEEINYASGEQCFTRVPQMMNEENRIKLVLWEEYRCGSRSQLPIWFFEEPPFIHPSGMSYVFLAYLTGKKAYTNIYWILTNLMQFHLTELQDIRELKGRIKGPLNYLSMLSDEELREMSNGRPTILNRDYMLAKNNYGQGPFSDLEYRLYNRADLDLFLKESQYNLDVYRLGRKCLYRDGPLCWNFDTVKMMGLMSRGTMVAFIVSMIILGIVVWQLWSKIRNNRIEEERKRLALQVLTHEFRTPIASLMLNMESFIHKPETLSKLDPEFQETFLRMTADIHRLKRLTETSRNYLKATDKVSLIDFHVDKIPSLNSFVAEMVDDFENVNFIPLTEDAPISIDTYWFSIILKNLIDNALIHGKPVVDVKLEREGDFLVIKVQDQGTCQFKTIEELTGEFVKGSQSQGTGLGLNIVMKVIKEMGGEIQFQQNPTTFIVKIKNNQFPSNKRREHVALVNN